MTNLFARGDFMRKQFSELDRDGDGFITEADLKACIKGHPFHACAVDVITNDFAYPVPNNLFSAFLSDMIGTEIGRSHSKSIVMVFLLIYFKIFSKFTK